MSYNLRNGAANTYSELVAYTRQLRPDVLCLQEADHWHEGQRSRLERFAADAALPYYKFGDSNTASKLATFSKYPIRNSVCVTKGFWHCALAVTVPWHGTNLTIWNIHFDPRSPRYRLAEAKLLISHIRKPQQTIITGDFNSISRADGYPQKLLDSLVGSGIHKFGTTNLSFDELDYLLRYGFIDIASENHAMKTTVPTTSNNDDDHAVALRLDYILASRDISPYVTGFDVMKNTLTNRISDHYPVVATITSTHA